MAPLDGFFFLSSNVCFRISVNEGVRGGSSIFEVLQSVIHFIHPTGHPSERPRYFAHKGILHFDQDLFIEYSVLVFTIPGFTVLTIPFQAKFLLG